MKEECVGPQPSVIRHMGMQPTDHAQKSGPAQKDRFHVAQLYSVYVAINA